jgi:hypothetical protein
MYGKNWSSLEARCGFRDAGFPVEISSFRRNDRFVENMDENIKGVP